MSGPDAFPAEMWHKLRFRHGPDPLDLDEQTAGRLVSGAIPPDDVPPAYRETARVIYALTRPATPAELAGESRAVAGIAATVTSSPSPPYRRSTMVSTLRSAKGIGVAAVAGALSLFGGLAAAGALPGAAQQAASDALAKIGISVPSPDDHAGDHPATRGGSTDAPGTPTGQPSDTTKGSDIADTARTTDATGVDKGAEISTKASGGNSQAGDHGNPTTTTPSLPDRANTPDQANRGLSHRP